MLYIVSHVIHLVITHVLNYMEQNELRHLLDYNLFVETSTGMYKRQMPIHFTVISFSYSHTSLLQD